MRASMIVWALRYVYIIHSLFFEASKIKTGEILYAAMIEFFEYLGSQKFSRPFILIYA